MCRVRLRAPLFAAVWHWQDRKLVLALLLLLFLPSLPLSLGTCRKRWERGMNLFFPS